jgi:hypothetical protein
MKNRAIWLMVPTMALCLGACKKKEASKTPQTVQQPAVTVETPVTPAPSASSVKPLALSPEERAAKLGFVKHLPQDTEVVMAFHNGSKSAEIFQSSKLWKLMQSQMGGGMMGQGRDMAPSGEEVEEDVALPEGEQDVVAEPSGIPDDANPMGPAALFGTEFTIALGKSVGQQSANLLTLYRRMGYFQMRSLAKTFVEAAKSNNISSMASELGDPYDQEMFKELLNDPESGLALFEKMNMPPLYLAFRAPASGLDAAAQQIAAFVENLAMLGEMVEPVEVEKVGKKFTGHKISGAKISALMADDRAGMEEVLDAANVDRLLAAVAKKDPVILSGTVGDYVILFIGSSVDDLKFAPDISQSLVASEALAFCDPYASKQLAAMIYGQKDALNLMRLSTGGLADLAGGLRDGLAASEGLGTTRDLETLLRMVAERETALRKLAGTEALGVAAFFENGLKIESYGGTDNGMVDWKSPNKLASLGDSQDVVMFANMTTEAAYDEKARAYIEAIMETSYAAAMKVSEMPLEGEKMLQFKEMAKIFDTQFRPDAVAIWDSISNDFGGALGNERAWVMDLKGSVPTIPGIPQAVVDSGKFPRISVVAPVLDRSKLADSWKNLNTSFTGVLAKIKEMSGMEIPMQKPISSEKNGYTTWFFPVPVFNDDFMPSLTVGDQWFAASTSKNQALDLLSQAAAGGETRTGLQFTMNFKALEKFSQEMHQVLEKNSEALGISSKDLNSAAELITALEDLDKLTVHSRREGGVLRSSVHFKTR